jgi:dTDP-4-amino-4,6-dideoxygalactose transaminase
MRQPVSLSLPSSLTARLAVEGGVPVRRRPPPSWPVFAEDEIAEVAETLRSGKVNQWTGERVCEFERTFAATIGRPHGLALANGTIALETMLRAYDIGAGDEVIVTPRSFIASASSVDLVGATPVFADIELDSEMITPATVSPLINARTKAVIVVHLHGRPADMPGFLELARRYRLRVFEDCAQAQGAKIDGQPVGSFGDAGAFSFCQDKIMTTGGEGGMVVLADLPRWKRAWSRRENGKDYDAVYNSRHGPGYRWVYRGLGTNARMSEMQAAIGLRQLPKVKGWLAARTAHACQLAATLADYPSVCVSPLPAHCEHAYYRFAFRIQPSRLGYGWSRDLLLAAFIAEGIPCFAGPCPEIYREHSYARSTPNFPRLANAATLGEVSLTLLVHPTLDQAFLDDTRTALRKVLDAATRFSPRSAPSPQRRRNRNRTKASDRYLFAPGEADSFPSKL